MAKTLTSVFEQLAKLLGASGRAHDLQRHGDLARQFALVAPLGGGAMLALQALHAPESDDAWSHLSGPLGAVRWAVY